MIQIFLIIGIAQQLIENARLTLTRAGLFRAHTQGRSQLTSNNRRTEKDDQCQPLLWSGDRKGVEWDNQEKVEREKGDNRGKNGRIETARARQSQDNYQVDQRNTGNPGIEMETIDQQSHSQSTNQSQQRIRKIAPP